MKKILIALLVILPIVVFFVMSKPQDDSKIKQLEKKCDSLQLVINENNTKIDSIKLETEKLHQRANNLNKELTKINKKAQDLKKQHEKNIAHINSLSNNDVARLFTDEFSKIE